MVTTNTKLKSGPYACDGVQDTFDVDFDFLDSSAIIVKLNDGTVETDLSLGVDYTVTGGNIGPGTIVTTSVYASPNTITIIPNNPLTQTTKYEEQQSTAAATQERALDKLVLMIRQIKEELSRAVKVNASEESISVADLNDAVVAAQAAQVGAEAAQALAESVFDGVTFTDPIVFGSDIDVSGQELISSNDVVVKLGDAAGAYALTIKDSAGTIVSDIDSDGAGTFTNLSVDNININANSIISTDVNGDINITPNGTGNVVLDGINWPTADGSADQILTTDGAGNLSFSDNPPNTVVQVATATTNTKGSTSTSIPWDDTIPQNTEGAEALTCSITPTSSSNKLIIEFTGFFGGAAGVVTTVALFKDSTADALTAVPSSVSVSNFGHSVPLVYTMTAGTTSSITFKIRYGPSSGTSYFLQSNAASKYSTASYATLKITEVTV